MSNKYEISEHYDVIVVGFGPAGAVAAAMLGQRGHSTLVIDRMTGIYEKPRAIAIDHEILRHFDNMGIAEDVLPFVAPFTASQHFGAQGQLIRRIDMVPEPYPLGYTPSMVFTQPPVEKVLRSHAESLSNVTIELGVELIDIADTGNDVVATLRGADGVTRNVGARYAIGCDGASSTVRQIAGMKLEDLVFDEPWLVVDVEVNSSSLAKLPETSAQFCDPSRPTSFIIGPKNHRRWEIMLLPGEDAREMEKPENVWRLLSPWLSPQDGTLWRAASYRFHALVADDWRRGRIMIAGDAAHQQPPFIGQGMCQGLRDVSNLVWKLDRVIKGLSTENLLDSYTVERKRHVRSLTGKIKAIGQMICERDPALAAERDQRIIAEGGGKPPTITRQEIVPPLEEGLIGGERTPARGVLFPQPAILAAHGGDRTTTLLDHITGTGWRLVLDGRKVSAPEVSELAQAAPEMTICVTVPASAAARPEGALVEKDGVLTGWFERHGTIGAIVRPDHYVYAGAATVDALQQQLSELQTGLAA